MPAVQQAQRRHIPGVEDPESNGTISEISLTVGAVQRLEELTAEYLDARANLLRVYGRPAIGLHVNWSRPTTAYMNLAWASYYRGEPTAAFLLLHALRVALLEYLHLSKLHPKYQLGSLPTHHLVVVAQRANIQLPLGPEKLGNILVDLEGAAARCEPIKPMLLFPYLRLGTFVVEKISSGELTEEQLLHVRQQLQIEVSPSN